MKTETDLTWGKEMAQKSWSKGGLGTVNSRLLLILLGLMGFSLSMPEAFAGSYRDSAHGQNINRSHLDLKFSSYATGNCAHCHEAHASLGGSEPGPSSPAGANPALRFSPIGQFCTQCHDGSVAPNIKGEFQKMYSHTAGDPGYAGRHTMSIHEAGQDGAPFRGNLRHDECVDCHNPHTAQKGLHS